MAHCARFVLAISIVACLIAVSASTSLAHPWGTNHGASRDVPRPYLGRYYFDGFKTAYSGPTLPNYEWPICLTPGGIPGTMCSHNVRPLQLNAGSLNTDLAGVGLVRGCPKYHPCSYQNRAYMDTYVRNPVTGILEYYLHFGPDLDPNQFHTFEISTVKGAWCYNAHYVDGQLIGCSFRGIGYFLTLGYEVVADTGAPPGLGLSIPGTFWGPKVNVNGIWYPATGMIDGSSHFPACYASTGYWGTTYLIGGNGSCPL